MHVIHNERPPHLWPGSTSHGKMQVYSAAQAACLESTTWRWMQMCHPSNSCHARYQWFSKQKSCTDRQPGEKRIMAKTTEPTSWISSMVTVRQVLHLYQPKTSQQGTEKVTLSHANNTRFLTLHLKSKSFLNTWCKRPILASEIEWRK